MHETTDKHQSPPAPSNLDDRQALYPGPDFSIRAAQQIPIPKDWQALQRGCVILFQADYETLTRKNTAGTVKSSAGSTSSAVAMESCLTNSYADQYDLLAYVNNAAVLLRLSGRQADCESLLSRALPLLPGNPQLKRLLALSQAAQDRFDDAEATLRNDADPENQLLATEMIARRDAKEAIKHVESIDATGSPDLAEHRWRILGDLALKVGDYERVNAAVDGLRSLPESRLLAELFELRRDARLNTDEDERHERLRKLAEGEFSLNSSVSRYLLAEEMRSQDLPADAARLLEPLVDLAILNPATRLYLECLVDARRDEAFRQALATADRSVASDPDILWLSAAHSWNTGDLLECRRTIDALLIERRLFSNGKAAARSSPTAAIPD